MKKRLTFIEYGLIMAKATSARSEDPTTKVGAALFDIKTKRIISTGYNGITSGREWPKEFNEDRDLKGEMVIHAEQNALLGHDPNIEKVLFMTMSPCFSCAKLIVSPLCNVKEVYYIEEYKREKEFKFRKVFGFYEIQYREASPVELNNITNYVKNIKI